MNLKFYWMSTVKFFEDESQIFRLRHALSENELNKINALKSKLGEPLSINLGIYHNNEFVVGLGVTKNQHFDFICVIQQFS